MSKFEELFAGLEDACLVVKTKNFKVKVNANGDKQWFQLRELTGLQRDEYLNLLKAKSKTVGGERDITDFRGLQSALLSRTIFKFVLPEGVTEPGPTDVALPIAETDIQGWASSAQKMLHDISNEFSALGGTETEEDAGKNS